MAQTIKLRRSGVEGSVPTTAQLALGEVAINTFDGRAFIHKSGSGPGAPPESIEHLITTNSETTGSINLIGNITASGDISASGNLYAGLTENSSNYNTVVYNTSTGQFFYTGSYGGNDNLGNHTATQNLNMGGNDITNVGNVDGVNISILNSSVSTLNTLVSNNITNITELVTSASLALVTASAVDNVITFEKGDGTTFPVTIDTGSGLTVGGQPGAIQYSDGAGNLDYNNFFKWDDTNGLDIGTAFKVNLIDQSNNPIEQPIALVTGFKNTFQLSKATQKGIYASFDRLSSHFMLHPHHQLNNALAPNTTDSIIEDNLIASSRFHVIDRYPKAHVAKIINLSDSAIYGKENLLLGTRHDAETLSGAQDVPYHKFIDFHIKCGVHHGISIAGIYYDPTDALGGGDASASTVKYQGILVNPSDKKLKKHITDTKKGIDDIMSMKVKDYRWKGNPRTSTKSTGLIAQELQETHPELISNLDNTLNVNYTGIIPMLIKAIQDQQEQIDDLKKQLENK